MSEVPFHVGGPLLADSRTYVLRKADEEAAIHLSRMEYMTLIEPRQHGKTSLINRLIGQFSSQGYTFAYRDLMAAKSSDASPHDWYSSLGRWLLRQLAFIPRNQRPKPPSDSASWENFLADVAESANVAGQNAVVVLDEIGAMPSGWATDFFSVIRSIYTSRQSFAFWNHLTFIIAGAFNPKKLIQDDTVSNFNVAQRIPLHDFYPSQVKQLVSHLHLPADMADAVTKQVYYWTNGQPYLTQRLCRHLAECKEPMTAFSADAAVKCAIARLFCDDTHHLARIAGLATEPSLLAYARRITSEPRVRFIAALNDKHFHLAHIIGVIKADADGFCRIRNRIYEKALAEVRQEQTEGERDMTGLPPAIKVQAISFLFDIGRWAAAELKERWTLARQKADSEQLTEADLSKPKEEVEQELLTLLEEISAERGAAEVRRAIGLIEQRRQLILEWRESKVANEEEYSRQLISRAALRLRQQELDRKISQTLLEIAADLEELGLQVKREQTE